MTSSFPEDYYTFGSKDILEKLLISVPLFCSRAQVTQHKSVALTRHLARMTFPDMSDQRAWTPHAYVQRLSAELNSKHHSPDITCVDGVAAAVAGATPQQVSTSAPCVVPAAEAMGAAA